MKKLLSIILSITMLLSMATVAFADDTFVSSGAREVEGIIKVGVNAEFPPFEYMENDKLLGFDIDLMNYIAASIGYGVEFVNMSFDKLIPAVVNGEVDCAISAITATDERESVVDFTRPYLAANVTYKDGDATSEELEMYSIVFKDGVADTKYLSRTPTTYERLFMLVNGTIEELISDGTIDKLITQYDLNKPYDEEADYEYGYYEYMVLKSTVTDAKEDLEIPKVETWDEATTVPAPSEWAAKEIDYARAVGITDANKDYLYKENITREEFCELIYNLVTSVKWEITAPITDSFTDTKNDKILMLNGLGIINGKSATEFAPNDLLTREEAATIIDRMIEKVLPSMFSTELYFEFADSDKISDWAMPSIQSVCNFKFMNGVGNNNFAPKDNYTTEQAIVTLARVFEGAEAAGAIDHNSSIGIIGGAIDHNSSIGIIGGADGPTSIIVGDNTINVDKEQEYNNYYAEIKKNTKKVDDFYIDEAIKLTTESGTLASDKDFISYYTPSEDARNKVLAIGAVDYSKPTEVYYLSANREQIIANIKALSDEELDGFDIEKLLKLNKVDFSVITNLVNASYGADNLAALTVLTNSRGYVMPKDFTNDFAIYLQYDGEYSALVSFSEFGDGVIKATMSFVNNGERDNVFRRIYEIAQGLGEDSIDVAIVK